MRRYNIDEEFLKHKYVIEKKCLREIAEELGVSRQTIANKLKEYKIPIRNSAYISEHKKVKKIPVRKIPPYHNKDKFQEVYGELKSLDLVAEYFGINITTACDWKNRHGIPTIRGYSFKARKVNNEGKPYADEETLRKMYADYSLEDLAKMWNCSPSTISKWCKKFGIKTRTISEQWDLKAKFGSRVVKKEGFDLQLYLKTYSTKDFHIPRGLKNYILSLYGACECCGYTDVLDLHHIDQNRKNNKPENHSVLCPNCHAKIHRLGIPFEELVPFHQVWSDLANDPLYTDELGKYQEAK